MNEENLEECKKMWGVLKATGDKIENSKNFLEQKAYITMARELLLKYLLIDKCNSSYSFNCQLERLKRLINS
ncbi:MAG: hypothetical protein HWE10_03250 [Gammaproteobacteria bacterium]|nr:hypothetical protein [Gammaproteobacteria bacterium]